MQLNQSSNLFFSSLQIDTIMSSVPLTDVLPWGDCIPTGGRTILICDSAETDGRFLLHTIATQCLNNNTSSSSPFTSSPSYSSSTQMKTNSKKNKKGKVLWIHCGSSTNNDIKTALKKSGCDPSIISFQHQNNLFSKGQQKYKDSQLDIININNELSEYYMTQECDTTSNYDVFMNNYHNSFIKGIYIQVKEWMVNLMNHFPNDDILQSSSTDSSMVNPLIILDNASLLSTQVGSKLTHVLIQKIQDILTNPPIPTNHNPRTCINDKSKEKGIGCLTILCSHDFDQEYYLSSTQQSKRNTNVTGGKIIQYIGCGSRGILCDSEEMTILNQKTMYEFQYIWERSLIELADGVIDVIPLASGFARDVHGRLVFTERLGSLGWKHRTESRPTGSFNTSSTRSSDGKGRNVSSKNSSSSSVGVYQNNFSTTTVNFCCNDNGVRAIRLRV